MKKFLTAILLSLLLISSIKAQTIAKSIKRDIMFKSGRNKLAGTLISMDTNIKSPVIVFLVGSGNSSYDGNYREFSEKFLEKIFLERGYAIFHFNKRGIGQSSGNWKYCNYYSRAYDAYSAIKYLKQRKDIDSTQIGVIGHSQGGWVAQLVGSAHKDVKFIINLAGPATGTKEEILDERQIALTCKGMDSTMARRKVEKELKKFHTMSMFLPFIGMAYTLLHEYKYYPDNAIKKLTCPSLFVFCENDLYVPAKKNEVRLKQLFNGQLPKNIALLEVKNAEHGLKVAPDCFYGDKNALVYSEEAKNNIIKWLSETGLLPESASVKR